MSRLFAVCLVLTGLMGCRFADYEERDPWRAEAEEKCIAERRVVQTDFVEATGAINGKGKCGMTRPFKVAAVSGGFVALEPKATLACPLVANVEAWFHEAIQPAAMAWYGSPVVEIKQLSAYSCRTMNGQPGASISEHAFGNALDIASFRFADGREVNFKGGWKGKPEERGFLRAVHAGACERFSTVLAPGADMFHYDHIHVDLARRQSGRSVCKPAPQSIPAPPPQRYPDVPVAQAPYAPGPVAQSPQMPQSPQAGPGAQSPASTRPIRVRTVSISPHQPPNAPTPAPVARAPVAAQGISPWAQPGSPPSSVARYEPPREPAGEPLVLVPQAATGGRYEPPRAGIDSRVMQSLGPAPAYPQAAAPQPTYQQPSHPQPTYRPPAYPQPAYPQPVAAPPQRQPRGNPDRLVPPANIPNASLADPVVTGATGGAGEKPKTASVFDLQRKGVNAD